ncbi:MAG: aminotransferase, partial [Candidatus Dormibacteria bacterium]
FHKWCCAPRGSAFLAIAPGRLAGLRAGVAGALTADGFPAGLEWWGTADYSAWLTTPAAFDFLEQRGLAAVREHNRALALAGSALAATALQASHADTRLPMQLVPLPAGVGDSPPLARRLQAEIGERLGAEVAVTCARGRGFIRLSAHLYNRLENYAVLAERLPALLTEPSA